MQCKTDVTHQACCVVDSEINGPAGKVPQNPGGSNGPSGKCAHTPKVTALPGKDKSWEDSVSSVLQAWRTATQLDQQILVLFYRIPPFNAVGEWLKARNTTEKVSSHNDCHSVLILQ